ncbi:hypothetical protein R3P38DRAFT_2819779 [Favolaschia claudopus]|uniref:Uncharacterized protein n=1 Tax=Favolaschia claudopus TaxID=2862362 RepID=A0AAW0EHZ8_9AGAR
MQITPTLSPSTTIFTIATSYSLFTTAGHVTSTPVPVLSTSVMMVPITPTQTSKASKHSLSTSMSVGIAIAGVAVFLVGVLIYIVRWRRKLRRRAFLRLGEEF